MKQHFTIGEFAKLHDISESTLRYYDQKEIFQPKKVDPHTQYRYYTIDQFPMMDTIKFLRHLDISLNEIKDYVEHRTPDIALALLEKQMQKLLERQKEIDLMMLMTQRKIDLIKDGTNREPGIVTYKKLPKRLIYGREIQSYISDDVFFMYLNDLEKKLHKIAPIFVLNKIGMFVSKEGLLKGDYLDYSGLFIPLDGIDFVPESSSYINEGYYACTYHIGDYEKNSHTYDRFLANISRDGYEIIGDAIEIGIIDYSITLQEEELVIEYQIPVRKIR